MMPTHMLHGMAWQGLNSIVSGQLSYRHITFGESGLKVMQRTHKVQVSGEDLVCVGR